MDFYIHRNIFQHPDGDIKGGVYGRLEDEEGTFYGYTIEQPWNGNEPYKSCVPDGRYTLIPFDSPKYGPCFVLANPGLGVYPLKEDRLTDRDRFLCLFVHKGSCPWNFQGCIGLGDKLRMNGQGQLLVTNTADKCADLMSKLERVEHTLTIYTQPGCI